LEGGGSLPALSRENELNSFILVLFFFHIFFLIFFLHLVVFKVRAFLAL
jgi:hypothetical protein